VATETAYTPAAHLDEADALIGTFGDGAYYTARDLMRKAREQNDSLATNHFAKTALLIARRTGREVGLDTATRYLDKEL
jgi:hypothetical protein